MGKEKQFWIIGHEKDFDYIIIGENTGPYSEFPSPKYSRAIEGNFHYIENFVSQIEGKKCRVIGGPAFSKCPALDELNRNVKEPLKSFDSIKGLVNYLKKESIPFTRIAHAKKILENFSIEDLTLH